MEARGLLRGRADQFIDVKFSDIVNNPLGTVQRIYEFFGFKLTHETKQRMERHLEENHLNKFRKKHGTHRYTPEMFGLDRTRDAKRFSEYCDRFEVKG